MSAIPARLGIARAALARLVAVPGRVAAPGLSLGSPVLDSVLPGGALARGALHEALESGPGTEYVPAAARFVAGLLAPLAGPVLWVCERADLYPPALAALGLAPPRLICVAARRPAAVLAVLEDALHARAGLAGVVGECSAALDLTASRRLHLAAECAGLPLFLLRRSPRFDDPAFLQPDAAATRWRITPLPSAPPRPAAPELPGLGPALWRLELLRCRGGLPHSWIVEAPDATGRCRLVSDLADRSAAPRRAA